MVTSSLPRLKKAVGPPANRNVNTDHLEGEMHPASTMAPAPSSTIAPPRANQQHMQALARANEVRLARAALKRTVAAGSRNAADVILDCPWEVESMPVGELLASQRRWGTTRSRKFITALSMSENKKIGTLTKRQRMLLATALARKNSQPLPATA